MVNREKNFKIAVSMFVLVLVLSVMSAIYNNGLYMLNLARCINFVFTDKVIFFAVTISMVLLLRNPKKRGFRYLLVAHIVYYTMMCIIKYFINPHAVKKYIEFITQYFYTFGVDFKLDKLTNYELCKKYYLNFGLLIFLVLAISFCREIIFRKRFLLAISEYKKYILLIAIYFINSYLFFTDNINNEKVIITLCITFISTIDILYIYGFERVKKKFNVSYKEAEQYIKNKIKKLGLIKKYEDGKSEQEELISTELFESRKKDYNILKSTIDNAVRDESIKGYSIGVTAEWGMGKTYFLETFANKYYKNSYVKVTPSVFIKKSDIYEEIINGIENVFRVNKLYSNKKDSIGSYLTELASLFSGETVSGKILSSYKSNLKSKSTFEDIRDNLSHYIGEYYKIVKKPIVIIIDDFDRLEFSYESENFDKEILQIIYELTNIKGIIVLYSISDISKYSKNIIKENENAIETEGKKDNTKERKLKYKPEHKPENQKITKDDKKSGKEYYSKYINNFLMLSSVEIEDVVNEIFNVDTNRIEYYNGQLDISADSKEIVNAINKMLNYYYKEYANVNVREIEQIIVKSLGILNEILGTNDLNSKEKQLIKENLKLFTAFAIIKERYTLEYYEILDCNSYFEYEWNHNYLAKEHVRNFVNPHESEQYKSKTYDNINDLVNMAIGITYYDSSETDRYLYCNADKNIISEVKYEKIKIIDTIFYTEKNLYKIKEKVVLKDIIKNEQYKNFINDSDSVEILKSQFEMLYNIKDAYNLGIKGTLDDLYKFDHEIAGIKHILMEILSEETNYDVKSEFLLKKLQNDVKNYKLKNCYMPLEYIFGEDIFTNKSNIISYISDVSDNESKIFTCLWEETDIISDVEEFYFDIGISETLAAKWRRLESIESEIEELINKEQEAIGIMGEGKLSRNDENNMLFRQDDIVTLKKEVPRKIRIIKILLSLLEIIEIKENS